MITIKTIAFGIFLIFSAIPVFGQRAVSLRGQVTDQFAAAIVGATVTLVDQNGKQQSTQTNDQGDYRFNGLAPGTYDLRATQSGFAPYDEPGLNLSSSSTAHNFKLSVTIETQRVTIDDSRALSADPNSNKSARVI